MEMKQIPSNHEAVATNNELGDDEKTKNKEDGDDKNITNISDDIDKFLLSLKDDDHPNQTKTVQHPLRLLDSVIYKFLSTVDKDLSNYESADSNEKLSLALLDDIDRVNKLSTALSAFSSSQDDYKKTINRTRILLQRAMSFLEEEFRSLLEDFRSKLLPLSQDPDYCTLSLSTTNSNNTDKKPPPVLYPPEIVDKLHSIAHVMISAGYESECFQTFSIARHNAFDAALSELGFHKVSIDEVQKMQWESLQGKIVIWIQAFRQSISVFFPLECDLCELVFSEHQAIAGSLFNNLARSVLIQLLNFAEAITVTKGSPEKLFKVLDMYETLRDMLPMMESLFPGDEEATDLKSEILSARSRLGETALMRFYDLEESIKSDAAKTPVPGGAVHPLTRYVMNYLKYACEYRKTLEQVFNENRTRIKSSHAEHTTLATQLIGVMDLLDSNLELKSKLYKEMALSYIFLMNNGRYIVKKMKESTEIDEVGGHNWYRKRYGKLRQYHRNYQRESWGKVLECFRDEGGLQVKGNKAALKERMKSFNTMLEDIHKSQSTWVVSDEQLKSELRVSISAVLVPAYRSFLGRYKQYVNGKQAEKHIKFGPEDIESKINDLFDGNPSNHGRKSR